MFLQSPQWLGEQWPCSPCLWTVCACISLRKRVFAFVCRRWAFFGLLRITSRCHIELVQKSAEIRLDWRTIFFQDCPGVPVAKWKDAAIKFCAHSPCCSARYFLPPPFYWIPATQSVMHIFKFIIMHYVCQPISLDLLL